MRPYGALGYALAGLAWGCMAWILGERAVGPSILVGTAASPLIGVAVGRAFQRPFERASMGGRILLALASLYLGATLFGLVLGARALLVSGASRSSEVVWENVVGMWYVTTLFLIGLWPMAYLTHLALGTDLSWWRRPK
jgi:hypothetical protein